MEVSRARCSPSQGPVNLNGRAHGDVSQTACPSLLEARARALAVEEVVVVAARRGRQSRRPAAEPRLSY
jgi:hypothetical protein